MKLYSTCEFKADLYPYTEYQEQQLLENTRESETIACYSMLNVLFVSAILITNERKHTHTLSASTNKLKMDPSTLTWPCQKYLRPCVLSTIPSRSFKIHDSTYQKMCTGSIMNTTRFKTIRLRSLQNTNTGLIYSIVSPAPKCTQRKLRPFSHVVNITQKRLISSEREFSS